MRVKSKQDVELKISQAMAGFLKEQLGEDAKIIKVQIISDAIIIRFKSILPPAERHMIRSQAGVETINKLKEELINEVKPLLKVMIKKLINIDVIDVHSSFDAKADERVEIFTLKKVLEFTA